MIEQKEFRKLRSELKLTQQQIADQIEISKKSWERYEHLQREAPHKVFKRLEILEQQLIK